MKGNYLKINTKYNTIKCIRIIEKSEKDYLFLIIKDIKDNSISFEQFAKTYLNYFKTTNILNYINYINDYFPKAVYEYCNFIYYIFKLHKFVFNSETHKPKFEKIEIDSIIQIGMKLSKKEKGWYISYDNDSFCNFDNMKDIYPPKFLGKNIISNCIELNLNLKNLDEQPNFITELIKGCNFETIKELKLYGDNTNCYDKRKIEIIATSQIIEFIYIENILINFDFIYNLFKNNKHTLKKLILKEIELSNKTINDINLNKLYKSIMDLKLLEYVDIKNLFFPKKLLVYLLAAFHEKYIYSKIFRYLNFFSELIGTINAYDFPFKSFDKINKEAKLNNIKLKILDDNEKGFLLT